MGDILEFAAYFIKITLYVLYILYFFLLAVVVLVRSMLNGAWRVFSLFRRDGKVYISEDDVKIGDYYGSECFDLKCERLAVKLLIRGSLFGGLPVGLSNIIFLFTSILFPFYPRSFIEVSPVITNGSYYKSISIDSDIRFILYSFQRMAYDLSWNEEDGIGQLYQAVRRKLPFWKLVWSYRGLRQAGVSASVLRL